MITYGHSILLHAIYHSPREEIGAVFKKEIQRLHPNLDGIEPIPLLHCAVKFNKPEVIEVIKAHRGKLDLKDSKGWSAAMLCVARDNVECLKTLVDAGVNLKNDFFPDGSSLLHMAISHGNAEMTKQLVRAGLDVNVKNKQGMAPIHFIHGNLNMCVALEDAGADFEVSDANGNQLAHYAARDSQLDVLSWLAGRGIDLEQKNRIGQTAVSMTGKDFLESIQRSFFAKAAIDEIRKLTSTSSLKLEG